MRAALAEQCESSAAIWRGLDHRERESFRRSYEAIARLHDERVLNVGGLESAATERQEALSRADEHRRAHPVVEPEPMPVLSDEEIAENLRRLDVLLGRVARTVS